MTGGFNILFSVNEILFNRLTKPCFIIWKYRYTLEAEEHARVGPGYEPKPSAQPDWYPTPAWLSVYTDKKF
jgi:hypothetical protein